MFKLTFLHQIFYQLSFHLKYYLLPIPNWHISHSRHTPLADQVLAEVSHKLLKKSERLLHNYSLFIYWSTLKKSDNPLHLMVSTTTTCI